MSDLPSITVVTPSYNQGSFLRATLDSVLDQDYPELQYVVVDGGSTDGSVEILEEYSDRLAWWVSEPDRGQSHAINKGFARATGDVLGWLNSDDRLLPGALHTIGTTLADATGNRALTGACHFTFEDGDEVTLTGAYTSRDRLLEVWRPYEMHQPAVWWRRELTDVIGPLREDLHHIMDFDYWLRLAELTDFVTVADVLADVSVHAAAKTGSDNFRRYHREQRQRAAAEARTQPLARRAEVRARLAVDGVEEAARNTVARALKKLR